MKGVRLSILTMVILVSLGLRRSSQCEEPLLDIAITGTIRSHGMNDPQYVLSFVPVQRLVLTAVTRPLERKEVELGLAGTGVTPADLVRLDLLREEGGQYRLTFLLLTVQDQRTMYSLCQKYGVSLANAFVSHRREFDVLAAKFPEQSQRADLMFDLVEGVAMNWGGLSLTTELGYRIQPPRHPDGSVYFVHATERGAKLDFSGMYLDSQTAPGAVMSFSTFGDGSPRLQGWPDVLDGIEHANELWKKTPDVYAALQDEYVAYLFSALDDAGAIMRSVSAGVLSADALQKQLNIPRSHFDSTLHVLLVTGYLKQLGNGLTIGVPLITLQDKPAVDQILELSRRIMHDWLLANYPAMKHDFDGLSPMQNGVPFGLLFSEVWHYDFAFAAKQLAASGFFADPHAPGRRYDGYVPLVWESGLLKMP